MKRITYLLPVLPVGLFQLPRMSARDAPKSRLRQESRARILGIDERARPAADKLFVLNTVCFCNARGMKKRITLKMCTLSCFVSSKSVLFNLWCVSELSKVLSVMAGLGLIFLHASPSTGNSFSKFCPHSSSDFIVFNRLQL